MMQPAADRSSHSRSEDCLTLLCEHDLVRPPRALLVFGRRANRTSGMSSEVVVRPRKHIFELWASSPHRSWFLEISTMPSWTT